MNGRVLLVDERFKRRCGRRRRCRRSPTHSLLRRRRGTPRSRRLRTPGRAGAPESAPRSCSFGTGALPGLRPSMIALSIRLSIRPGQTQFTRTPVAGAFLRRTFGQSDHGVLAGAVDRDVGRADQAGDRGGVDDAALFCLSITGSTCFMPRNTPTTLTSSTRRNVSSEYFVIGAMSPSMPALL